MDKSYIYMWGSFKEEILNEAVEIENVPELKWKTYDLKKELNDFEIEKELPNCVFEDVSKFCAYLYDLIEKQKNGETGAMLNNGYANIFYIKVNGGVFTVSVYWRAGVSLWYVSAYSRDDFRWNAGGRAFSATAESQALGSSDLLKLGNLGTLEKRVEKLEKILEHYNLKVKE